jgi:hypothetical protein
MWLAANGLLRKVVFYRMPHTGYRKPEKRTPFRLVALKGDEMFRSIWENGERGTPEQWRN